MDASPRLGGHGPRWPETERWLGSANRAHPARALPPGARDALERILAVLAPIATTKLWRGKRAELAGVRTHAALLDVRAELAVAAALTAADLPFTLGDTGVPNPDFVIRVGHQRVGMEITTVRPEGPAELDQVLTDLVAGAGHTGLDLTFSAHPTRIPKQAMEEIATAARQLLNARDATESQHRTVIVDDPRNRQRITVTVRLTTPTAVTYRLLGTELRDPLSAATDDVLWSGARKRKAAQGRSLALDPVLLLVDVSRLGAAPLRSAPMWARTLAGAEHFTRPEGYPFAAIGAVTQDLTRPDLGQAGVGLSPYLMDRQRAVLRQLCRVLRWSCA